MATRYWVDATALLTWGDILGWATSSGGTPGASVPVAGDAVVFDANSATAPATDAPAVLTLFASMNTTGGPAFSVGANVGITTTLTWTVNAVFGGTWSGTPTAAFSTGGASNQGIGTLTTATFASGTSNDAASAITNATFNGATNNGPVTTGIFNSASVNTANVTTATLNSASSTTGGTITNCTLNTSCFASGTATITNGTFNEDSYVDNVAGVTIVNGIFSGATVLVQNGVLTHGVFSSGARSVDPVAITYASYTDSASNASNFVTTLEILGGTAANTGTTATLIVPGHVVSGLPTSNIDPARFGTYSALSLRGIPSGGGGDQHIEV